MSRLSAAVRRTREGARNRRALAVAFDRAATPGMRDELIAMMQRQPGMR